MTQTVQTTEIPAFNTAPQFHVVAINPQQGSVAMKSFNEGQYRNWDGSVKSDGIEMEQFIEYYVRMAYGVVVNAPRFNAEGKMKSNMTMVIDPAWLNCDCGKGIYCPFNKQTVTYWNTEAM